MARAAGDSALTSEQIEQLKS